MAVSSGAKGSRPRVVEGFRLGTRLHERVALHDEIAQMTSAVRVLNYGMTQACHEARSPDEPTARPVPIESASARSRVHVHLRRSPRWFRSPTRASVQGTDRAKMSSVGSSRMRRHGFSALQAPSSTREVPQESECAADVPQHIGVPQVDRLLAALGHHSSARENNSMPRNDASSSASSIGATARTRWVFVGSSAAILGRCATESICHASRSRIARRSSAHSTRIAA